MVDNGDVRLKDLSGNDADTAADLGRLRQQDDVITARRDLLRTRRHWYPIMLEFHKFMVAISRIEDDGYEPPPCEFVVDHATLPGPRDFWDNSWCTLALTPSLRMMSLSGPTVSISS